jgi:hypothetical protein
VKIGLATLASADTADDGADLSVARLLVDAQARYLVHNLAGAADAEPSVDILIKGSGDQQKEINKEG